MNVSLVMNGCEVTSSNGLTSAIVNHYRCLGYSCLPEANFCGCDLDGSFDEMKRRVVDPSSWPWYDPNDPASTEYFGMLILNVDGLRSSTNKRDVLSNVNSLTAGVVFTSQREIVMSGLVFAASERGMAYGRRWEHDRWWSESCSCASVCGCDGSVTFRTDCPTTLDPADGLVELCKVITVNGPKWTNWREGGRCSSNVMRFEITLNALDPGFYGPSKLVLGDVFEPSQFEYEMWDCLSDEHLCGPECCSFCSEFVLDDMMGLDQDCCYCRPLLVTRRMVQFDAVPAGSEFGFDFEFYSGESVFENARVLFVAGTVRDDLVDMPVLGGFEVNRIPARTLVRIDGKTGCVRVLCDGVWQDAPGFVFNLGGLPFVSPRVKSSCAFTLVVEADAGTVADDAWVKVFRFVRFVN